MLAPAADYIPIDQREEEVSVISQIKNSRLNEYEIAEKFGLYRNFFKSKTKKMRLIRLLGTGNVEKGYLKYMQITEDLQREFNEICEVLDKRIWGFKTFDQFMDQKPTYTQKLKHEVTAYGIDRYKKISTVHTVIKQFRRLEKIRQHSLSYIPIEKRLPLTEKFIKKYYWDEKMTTEMIADALIVPEIWIQKEINRLGMQKKQNGIKLRGRKGYVMPEDEKKKHRKQPHARAVVQICPRKFKVLRRWDATGAVERDGWARENVRKAIKSAGLHDGFLWAYEGKEKEIIDRAKEKGNLEKKLKIWENGHIPKEQLHELYIVQDLDFEQVAEIIGCTPGAVACRASKFGFRKRKCINDKKLKHLYLVEKLSAGEIAEQEGYSVSSIRTYLSKRGITRRRRGK